MGVLICKEVFKETISKPIVATNPRTKNPQMTEIKSNKTHKDSIKVKTDKDDNSKIKLNDYFEGVANTLTKLVGKTHISYFICMGIKKQKSKKKPKKIKLKKKIKKNTKDKKNTQKNKKDKKILKKIKKTKKIKTKKKDTKVKNRKKRDLKTHHLEST